MSFNNNKKRKLHELTDTDTNEEQKHCADRCMEMKNVLFNIQAEQTVSLIESEECNMGYYLDKISFIKKYSDFRKYFKERHKTIPVEVLCYNEFRERRFVLQHGIYRHTIMKQLPSLADIWVAYKCYGFSVSKFENDFLPNLMRTKFTQLENKFKLAKLDALLNRIIELKKIYVFLIKCNDETLNGHLMFVVSQDTITNNNKTGTTETKLKIRLVSPTISIPSPQLAFLFYWSYHLSKELLQIGFKLSTYSPGTNFVIKNYSTQPHIEYNKKVRPVHEIDTYIKRNRLYLDERKDGCVEFPVGFTMQRKKNINATLGERLFEEIKRVYNTRDSRFYMDPEPTGLFETHARSRIKMHQGGAFYVYNLTHKEECKENSYGLRNLKKPGHVSEVLLELIEMMGIDDFCSMNYHIGVNLYHNCTKKSKKYRNPSIEAHNEALKFATLHTVSFGKETVLSIAPKCGGTNSMFQISLKRHCVYTFDMDGFCMKQPTKHAVFGKHMRMAQGEKRIAVMVRKIHPRLVKELATKKHKKHRND